MAVTVSISVKMPVWRIHVIRAIIHILAPFIRSDTVSERIASKLSEWVVRGLVVKVA